MEIYMVERTDQSPHYRLFNVWDYDRTVLSFDNMDEKDFFEIFDEDTVVHNCHYHYRYYWERNGRTGLYDVFETDPGIWYYVIKVDDTGEWLMARNRGTTLDLIRTINDKIDTLTH